MTLFWYDLETFGRHPRLDRIAQFAGVRTTDKFEPLGDPLVLYCKITPDYLPQPSACLVTGLTPQETLDRGIPEYEFIKLINAEFSKPGTCVVGYNNLRFDDEFIRSALYRNFFDPYRREYSHGNSRWDLVDVVRAAKDLRPEGLVWPERTEGERKGSADFTLAGLAKANSIGHDHAHDALSDVFATIGLAKKIHDAQPKLFKWLFHHRTKDSLAKLVDLSRRRPFVHTSRTCANPYGSTSLMVPLTIHPGVANRLICWDLRYDPAPLLDLPVDELRRRMFTRWDELPAEERIHLRDLYLNRCPVVAPVSTLSSQDAQRLGLDLQLCEKRAEALAKDEHLIQKVRALYEGEAQPRPEDPDMALYSGGFFKDDDKAAFERLHATPAQELANLRLDFRDPRLPELFFRFLGRNFPEYLSQEQTRKWKSFCAGRILFPPAPEVMSLADYEKRVAALLESLDTGARDKIVLRKLLDWSERLKNEVLAYTP